MKAALSNLEHGHEKLVDRLRVLCPKDLKCVKIFKDGSQDHISNGSNSKIAETHKL
jgi:hypothetical protein